MLLFYSYEKIYLLARGDSTKIMLLFKRLLDKKYDALSTLQGNNWIVNPSIFALTREDNVRCAEFLGLLSFRHYAEYKCTGKTELSVRDLPSWVKLSSLTPSTLWSLHGNTIVFPTEKPLIL